MIVKRLKQWMRGAKPSDSAEAGGPADEPPSRVLMVCMGNICRSPIAEGVLRAKLRQLGLAGKVLVDSAGTHGYHTGEAPDPRAIRQAAQRGYDIAGLQARPVREEDFQRFDWLLAMDEANLTWLQRHRPADAPARAALLMTYARQHTEVMEVPDPYYGATAGFDRVLDLVEDACEGFVAQLTDPSSPGRHRV